MVAYFIWAKSPRGPVAHIQYDVLGKEWDTSKTNCRAYSVHVIPDEIKARIKEVADGDFAKTVEELSKIFPKPNVEGDKSGPEGMYALRSPVPGTLHFEGTEKETRLHE